MSPKTSTTASIASLIALLSFTLTVTGSLAQPPCEDFPTVKDLLKYYELPAGFFPDNVDVFYCPRINEDQARVLIMYLNSSCTVTSVKFGVNYTVQFTELVSAVVHTRLLTNIKGVDFVNLSASSYGSPYGPLNLLLNDALEVKFSPPTGDLKFVQFFVSATGSFSPTLPVALIPSEPLRCTPADLQQAALDKKRHANDNQQGTPNYYGGRLLPPAGLLLLNY